MDIKFGFADTARELVISAAGDQAELTQKINSALADNSTLELEDDKGRKYLVRTLTAWSTSRLALQRSTPWDSPVPKASA